MGLLDDAIREHLELKRLKGANPGEVAREEHEALGPASPDVEASRDDYGQGGVLEADRPQTALQPGASTIPPGHVSTVGQETVELDMDEVLESGPSPAQAESSAVGADVEHSQHDLQEGDSLEWEVPVGHERGGEDDHDLESHQEDEEPVEDVLEETPDFLRDTPEQERLWFEQRPPRDFDFNE